MTSDSGREQRTGRRGSRAYIGSFTSAGGRGITAAAVDPETGALRILRHTEAAVPDPSYLAVRHGRLYAVCETEEGAAAVLSLEDPDRPVPVGAPVSVRAAGPTHLALADGRLFTANYTSGSVSSMPLRADGTLGGNVAVYPHQGAGPDPDRQSGPHAHAVIPDPSGRWLLAVDLGTDSVWIYRLDGAGGEAASGGGADGGGADGRGAPGGVRLQGQAALTPGSGPRQLRFHPGGGHAYVVDELSSTVTVCRWDQDAGKLEPLDAVSVLPAGASGPNYPSELVIRADGRFAWVANRGHDSIAVLALDASGATMELTGTVSCGGHWPRGLALHPSGRRLYAANERSGDVTWFEVDEGTGMPRRTGSAEAPAASCVVFG